MKLMVMPVGVLVISTRSRPEWEMTVAVERSAVARPLAVNVGWVWASQGMRLMEMFVGH